MKLLSKIKSNETIINGSLFSFFSFVNKGFLFLLLLVLANYISPAEYGFLSLFNTVTLLIGYFITLSTEGYLSVSFFKDDSNGLKQTFSCILFTGIIMAMFLLAFLFFCGEELSVILDIPLCCLLFAIVISFGTKFSNLFLDYLRLQKKVKIYGFFSCGNALSIFIFSIVFVKFFLLGWQGCVYAQGLCCFVFGLMGFFFFYRKRFISVPRFAHWKMMLLWGIPLIPHLATTFIRQGCDRYIVNYFHSIDDVGFFSFALNLTNIIIMLGMGFNQSNSVEIFAILGNAQLTESEKKCQINIQRRNIFWIYLICSVVITLACVGIIPFILPKFSEAIKYFPILAVYAFFNCLYFLYTNFLFFYRKTKNLMYVTFGSSVFHLIMSLLLTKYSLYYTCCVYCVSQMIILFFVRRMAILWAFPSKKVEININT